MLRLRRKCMSWASCDRCIHLSSSHWIQIILHRQVRICPSQVYGKTLSSLKIDGLPTSSHRWGSWCLILVRTKSIQILSFRPCLAGKLWIVYENALKGLSNSQSVLKRCMSIQSILWSDSIWLASVFRSWVFAKESLQSLYPRMERLWYDK